MITLGILAILSSASCSLVNQELPNEEPVLQVTRADTTRVSRGGVVSLVAQASDEDDDPLIYTWNAFGAGTFTDTAAASTQWIAPEYIDSSSVTYVITVTVSDQQPDTEDVAQSFLIEVVQRAPFLTAPGDTVASFRDPVVALEASATDADDDDLAFSWEVLDTFEVSLAVQSPETGISRALLRPLFPGQVHLRLSVTDGADTAAALIAVTVEAPPPPDGGMVQVERSLSTGGTVSFWMDAYEYPNQLGVTPLLVDSWFEAAAICDSLGKRLCSPVEWESACRGPEEGAYSSPDDPDDLPASFGLRFCNSPGSAVAGDDPEATDLAPSGRFPNCSSSAGVYDLVGNAQEWLERVAPFGVEAGRYGRAQRSSATFTGNCGSFSSEPTALPLADELDLSDPAVIDSLRRESAYLPYFSSGMGFRCCR